MGLAHNFAGSSVLHSGTWVKIHIEQTGVCKITYDELTSMGLNPDNVRVYGYGGAELSRDFSKRMIDDLPPVPIYVEKGADGVFNKGDFILFYVQGPVSWQFDNNRFVHTTNTYSQSGYYFLSDNAGNQCFIEDRVMPQVAYTQKRRVTTYTEHIVHERDSLNLVDINGLSGGGKSFYGERIDNNSHLSLPIDIQRVVGGSDIEVACDMAAVSSTNVSITLTVNGQARNMAIHALDGSTTEKATANQIVVTFPSRDAANQTIDIAMRSGNAKDAAYLNYVEVGAQCSLVCDRSYLGFRTAAGLFSDTVNEYYLNVHSPVQVWDVTDLDSIRLISATRTEDALIFIGSNKRQIREYVAVNTSGSTFVPFSSEGRVENQNLHGLTQPYDMLIIAPREFEAAAWDLANAHELYDNQSVMVVRAEEVYNEFASGMRDATAYRRFAKMVYDRQAKGEKPLSYLLLFGDGSFDNRRILSNSGSHALLTYQADNSLNEAMAYATDDYFGFMDEEADMTDTKGKMHIAVGRLPVNTVTEAEEVVGKIITYMQNRNVGSWKNQLLFLADDGDNGQHTTTADKAAEAVRKGNPGFVVNKLYLDSYEQLRTASSESYPVVNNKFTNLMSSGVLFMNYCGHAGASSITSEGVMHSNDIVKMNNSNLGFWMLATCSFAHFDGNDRCGSELAVLNPHGGAIAVLSACRTVYESYNDVFNQNLCETLFSHDDKWGYEMTIGKATMIAKNACKASGEGLASNTMAYVLLGDPALKLNYPANYKVRLMPRKDTIRALDLDTIEGYISKSISDSLLSDTVADFNGKVYINIFDKMNVLQTRDNDQWDEAAKSILDYNDYTNAIFKGAANVRNGKFTLVHRIPKDIKYNYGLGRMVAYAFDTVSDPNHTREAIGYSEDFYIGGSSTVSIEDNQGPDIDLYLNTPSFVSGDKTHQSPHFYARIYDENGINTSGSGIGHDLVLVLDDNANQTYSMNDYYTSTDGEYQQGLISYRLTDIAEGRHKLLFRAWDMLNNSSVATLNFEVVKNMTPSLYSLVVYPNPVARDGILHFYLDYDRSDYTCEIELTLYNISGQRVWSATLNNGSQIECNLAQVALSPGIYLYRFRIKTADTGYTTEVGKIIVQ